MSVPGSTMLVFATILLFSTFPRHQRCASTSTAEPEFVAMTEAMKIALLVRDILVVSVPDSEDMSITFRECNQGGTPSISPTTH